MVLRGFVFKVVFCCANAGTADAAVLWLAFGSKRESKTITPVKVCFVLKGFVRYAPPKEGHNSARVVYR